MNDGQNFRDWASRFEKGLTRLSSYHDCCEQGSTKTRHGSEIDFTRDHEPRHGGGATRGLTLAGVQAQPSRQSLATLSER
jgi:hypothetical protein